MDDLKYTIEIYCYYKDLQDERNCIVKLQLINDTSTKPLYLGATEGTDLSGGPSYAFHTTFLAEYYFERNQELAIRAEFPEHNYNEEFRCTVGNLLGRQVVKLLSQDGTYEISLDAKKVESNKDNVSLIIQCPSYGTREIYYVLSNNNDTRTWRKIYKSEDKQPGTNFDEITMESSIMCRDHNSKILIEFFTSKNSEYLGKSIFKINDIISSTNTLQVEEGGQFNAVANITKNLNFVDYLKQGMQINIVVGVDFTMSNKHIEDPKSLHYINGNEPNGYERAIYGCGNILAQYDYDQQFPILGFGGIPEGGNVVEHSFPLNYNFNGSPVVNSVNEMVNVYRTSLKRTRLYGPTNFAPLIKNTTNIAKNASIEEYFILMILTDGCISDMEDTEEAIVEASHFPISIVIIGIGNEDFSRMDILDGDEIPLQSSISGRIVERDIVQFVEFRKYEGNGARLAEEVLQEIPKQVEDYYMGKKVDFKSLSSNQNQRVIQNQNMNNNNINNNNMNNNNMNNNNMMMNNQNNLNTFFNNQTPNSYN